MQVLFNSPDSLLAGFASGTGPGRLILVTGPSGSGKTRWCVALVKRARARGIRVGGLVSPAVFEDGHKVGIDLIDLDSHARRSLAVRRGQAVGGQLTDDWQIDDQALVWGNDLLAHSGESPLFILDELGPLELVRGVGLTNGISSVSARRYRLACVVIRPALLETGRSLWPWGEVFQIDPSHSTGASA